ncbi:MAG TPA: PilZ domain-containing protein [Gemmatimonadales bacterium]|nr:PilZ domain-containing protein [Gemmatimonadales bacterium]
MSRPWRHEREHYRIEYPTAARPRLVVGGHVCEVIDLSERGIRYRAAAGVLPGVVLRLTGDQVSCRLDAGVPFKQIVDEQRYLRDRHRGMAW